MRRLKCLHSFTTSKERTLRCNIQHFASYLGGAGFDFWPLRWIWCL